MVGMKEGEIETAEGEENQSKIGKFVLAAFQKVFRKKRGKVQRRNTRRPEAKISKRKKDFKVTHQAPFSDIVHVLLSQFEGVLLSGRTDVLIPCVKIIMTTYSAIGAWWVKKKKIAAEAEREIYLSFVKLANVWRTLERIGAFLMTL